MRKVFLPCYTSFERYFCVWFFVFALQYVFKPCNIHFESNFLHLSFCFPF